MIRWTCVAALFFITPFAAYHLLSGEAVLGAAGALVAGLLVLDFLSVRRLRMPLVPRSLALTLVAASAWICVYLLGESALYWTYPLVVSFHFLLPRRAAAILNAALLAAVAPLAADLLDTAALLRFSATLLLISVFAWGFARMVSRQWSALEQQLMTDPLTGAGNRRHLDTRIEAFVQRKRRHRHPASLILFDIDHFKSINDNYGHHVGDRVLRILVDTVKARIRAMDEIFRYGGEEFVILLPDTTLEQAAKLGQDITDMIADVRMIEGGPVTISCGVGELLEEENAQRWLERCDHALYRAKEAGRGRVCLATDSTVDEDDQITERRATYGVV